VEVLTLLKSVKTERCAGISEKKIVAKIERSKSAQGQPLSSATHH